MTVTQLESLRYPVGRFTKPETTTAAQVEEWIGTIEGLPRRLRDAVGGLEDELQVVVDPEKLAARRITIPQVRDVLRGQNEDTSAGDFWEGKRRWVVRALGQFRTPEQVENQLLAVRDGAPVFVRDVAEVRLGYKKPDGLVRRFGESSIALNCVRETGANATSAPGPSTCSTSGRCWCAKTL